MIRRKIKKKYNLACLLLIFLFIFFSVISKKINFSTQSQLRNLIETDGYIKKALFPRNNNITQLIIDLINNEKKSIKIAIFLLTDANIAQALIDAKLERNVDIEIVSCNSCITNEHNKIESLSYSGIKIYLFGKKKKTNNKNITKTPLMHNKFIIFEENLDNKTILLTGSFNFTLNAQACNRENIIVTEDKSFIVCYHQEFDALKKESKVFDNKKAKDIIPEDKMSLAQKFKETFRISNL